MENNESYQSGFDMGYQMGQLIGGLVGCVILVALPTLFVLSLIFAIVKKSSGWAIVATITGLIGIGLIVAAMATGIYLSTQPKEIQATSSAGVPYTMTTPSNWSPQSLGALGADTQWGNLVHEEYLVAISQPLIDYDESVTLDDYAQNSTIQIASGLNNHETDALETIEHSLYPARECRIEGSIDGVRIVYLNTYLKGEKDFYLLMMWTLPSKEEKAWPRFREVAASFREEDSDS